MNKEEFFAALRNAISALPASEAERSLNYYAEMIDDRIEDGMSEQDAVAAMGSVDSIARGIIQDTPLTVLVKEQAKTTQGKLNILVIILLVLGFPVWFPLVLTGLIIILSVYIVIWSLIVALFSIVLALGLAGVACLIAGLVRFFSPVIFSIGALGAGLALSGLTIGAFFAALYAAKGLIYLTKLFVRGIKSLFVRKERAA